MGEFFYTLFIWPIHLILELFFVLFVRIFDAPGPAVIFLSVVVNTLSLPIYIIADRWQKEERELQNRMKKKLISIRSVFSGDERQMIINAYYRQMGYSPLFILKASVGLIMQIPFFIAAYQFLSRTKLLTGISFIFIKDLNVPDALITLPSGLFGITAVNLLPVLMTAINLFSSFIYAKNLGKREVIQLFGMAMIFLVLLYNSPSGLVLYWTMNNLYSLIKNAAQTYLKKPGRVLQIAAILASFSFLYLIISRKASVERYGVLFSGIAVTLAVIPFIWQPLVKLFDGKESDIIVDNKNKKETDILYYSAIALLFLLIGFLDPAQVLSSSVSDFENPWSFLMRTILQSFSFLVLIPLFIKALSPRNIRKGLAIIWSFLTLNSLVCYFALAAYYGVMDRNFRFDDTDRLLHAFPVWVSIIVPLAASCVIAVFFILKKEKLLTVLFQAGSAAIIILICINLFTLKKGHSELLSLLNNEEYKSSEMQVYFPLSRHEKNVFIIFLDRAQGSAMSDALKVYQELAEELDGFVFYPNTLSFGANTLLGVPAMLGGYNYTPDKINERNNEFLSDKVNEAIKLMPHFFVKAGYRVTITDPVIANMQSVPDISIFKDMPNVNARLLSGKLTDRYRSKFPSKTEEGSSAFDYDILFRYGIFRLSPPALRYGIYYKGQWWREAAYNSYGRAIGEFSSLYYLPEICSVDDDKPTFNVLMNMTTHEGGSYNRDYFPQETSIEFSNEEIEIFGSKENAEYIFVLVSAIKQIAKWTEYLKREGIYDNTRIIVVSDHGGNYLSAQADSGMERYNPLLMIKDFDNRGSLNVTDTFMTHADTPYMAAKGIFKFYSGKIIKLPEKESSENGNMTAYSTSSSQPLRHGPYQFNLNGKRELMERDIFRIESWGRWEMY